MVPPIQVQVSGVDEKTNEQDHEGLHGIVPSIYKVTIKNIRIVL